jgi:hypothetical protein
MSMFKDTRTSGYGRHLYLKEKIPLASCLKRAAFVILRTDGDFCHQARWCRGRTQKPKKSKIVETFVFIHRQQKSPLIIKELNRCQTLSQLWLCNIFLNMHRISLTAKQFSVAVAKLLYISGGMCCHKTIQYQVLFITVLQLPA